MPIPADPLAGGEKLKIGEAHKARPLMREAGCERAVLMLLGTLVLFSFFPSWIGAADRLIKGKVYKFQHSC